MDVPQMTLDQEMHRTQRYIRFLLQQGVDLTRRDHQIVGDNQWLNKLYNTHVLFMNTVAHLPHEFPCKYAIHGKELLQTGRRKQFERGTHGVDEQDKKEVALCQVVVQWDPDNLLTTNYGLGETKEFPCIPEPWAGRVVSNTLIQIARAFDGQNNSTIGANLCSTIETVVHEGAHYHVILHTKKEANTTCPHHGNDDVCDQCVVYSHGPNWHDVATATYHATGIRIPVEGGAGRGFVTPHLAQVIREEVRAAQEGNPNQPNWDFDAD